VIWGSPGERKGTTNPERHDGFSQSTLHPELHSLKLTWPLKIGPWKRRFLLETTIFRGYVTFRECRWLKLLPIVSVCFTSYPGCQSSVFFCVFSRESRKKKSSFKCYWMGGKLKVYGFSKLATFHLFNSCILEENWEHFQVRTPNSRICFFLCLRGMNSYILWVFWCYRMVQGYFLNFWGFVLDSFLWGMR